MATPTNKRELIVIQPPKIGQIILFWLIVIVCPLLTGRFIANLYFENLLGQEIKKNESRLSEDLNIFSRVLHIEAFVEEQLGSIDQRLGHEIPLEPGALGKYLQQWKRQIQLKMGFKPIFCFASGQNRYHYEFNQEIAKDWGGHIGRAAVKIIFQGLANQSSNSSGPAPEIFWQIVKSVFGSDFSRNLKGPGIYSTFSLKLGGRRLFLYYFSGSHLRPHLKPQGAFLTAFTEDQIPGARHLQWAREYMKPKDISRNIVVKPATFSMKKKFADAFLYEFRPVPIETLRYSSHTKNSLLQKLTRNGFFAKKPARYLFLQVSADLRSTSKNIAAGKTWLGLIMLAVGFLSLHFLRDFATRGRVELKIRSKLFVGILMATVLPMALFSGLASQYYDFYQSLNFAHSLDFLKQNLQILELNIRNHELLRGQQLEKFRQKLLDTTSGSEQELQKVLNTQLSKLFDGYFFVRSDGLIIDQIPFEASLSEKDRKKLKMITELFKAQSLRVFKDRKILQGSYYESLKANPLGRQLIGMGEFFVPPDLENFCLLDGDSFKAEKERKDHYQFSSFNLLREEQFLDNNPDAKWAFVGFVQNVGRLTAEYFNSGEMKSNFFVQREGNMLVNTAVFRVEPQKNGVYRLEESWPKNFLDDEEFVQAALKLPTERIENSWISWQKIPVIYSVRKFDNIPFIAVSQGTIDLSDSASMPVLILALVLYCLILIIFISKTISSIFLRPLASLLRATFLVNEGNYGTIEATSDNELGQVVARFNQMTVGLIERQKLERFVSKEVSKTVELEILNQQEAKSERIEAAVLFAHIREFDSLCEELDPDRLISLLNTYYATFEPVIHQNQGVIDKYIGDGILVVFKQKSSAEAAKLSCKSALEMFSAQTELKRKLSALGIPATGIGVGIAFGEVIRGKIGAQAGRKDYTVIGDVVNLAARLESLSRQRQVPEVMVSAEIAEICEQNFSFAKFGETAIKGKEDKLVVFQLRGNR